MMKPYLKYEQTEDTVVYVKDRQLALAKTEAYIKTLKPKKMKRFDGSVVDFGETWGAVKVSVTEYALKLMFESKVKKEAQLIQNQIKQYIESIADATK